MRNLTHFPIILSCTCDCHIARKASWNPAGVEPIHWKPEDLDPGSPIVVQINLKGVYGVAIPPKRSFWCGICDMIISIIIVSCCAWWAMSSHVTYMIESCHTCEWVKAHTWMSHVTHIKHSSLVLRMMGHVTHDSCVCHDSFTCVTWLYHIRDMTRHSSSRATWHNYYWYTWLMCVPWLIHMCDMTHTWPSCATWLWMSHVSRQTYERVISHTYEWVMSHTWTIYVTCMNESHV